MSQNDLNAAAEGFAAQGVKVLPLRADKRPTLTKWGTLRNQPPATALDAYRREPAAMLGVLAGDRFDVLDVDGPQALADLVELNRQLHGTQQLPAPYGVAITPSGGWHLYVPTKPGGRKCASDYLGTGREHDNIDFKSWQPDGSNGGYVVCPPSNGYQWQQPLNLNAPADVDAWHRILDALEAAQAARKATPPQSPVTGAAALSDQHASARDGSTINLDTGEVFDGRPTLEERELAYARRALAAKVDQLTTRPPGTGRNNALNVAALELGHYVGHLLTEAEVIDALTATCTPFFHVDGHSPAQVAATIRSGLNRGMAEPWRPRDKWHPQAPTGTGPAPGDKPQPNTPGTTTDAPHKLPVRVILDMARERYTFGRTLEGLLFALPPGGHVMIPWGRSGQEVADELSLAYEHRCGVPAPKTALEQALGLLAAQARRSEPVRAHKRVAEHDGALWIDLGRADQKVIRLDGDGWQVADTAPVLFRRTNLTQAMPLPDAHNDGLAPLWELLNVNPDDRALILAWLVAALGWPEIPHPVLTFTGEQGTGKSSASRALVGLIDPSAAPTHGPPRTPERWEATATGSYVVALDNMSHIRADMSDLLCRAVTGDGFVNRKLYSDGDHAVTQFRSALILNGIDLGGIPNDLADRLLPIELDPIDQRRTETDLGAAWSAIRPHVLGALLDVVALARHHLPVVDLDGDLPRMADFARIVAALDHVHGSTALDRYRTKDARTAAEATEADQFIAHLTKHLTTPFEGRASELLDLLQPSAWADAPRWWPQPNRAGHRLKRAAANLRKLGWVIDTEYSGKLKAHVWTITPPVGGYDGGYAHTRQQAMPASKTPSQAPTAGMAGMAGMNEENSLALPPCNVCNTPLDPQLYALEPHAAHPGCTEGG